MNHFLLSAISSSTDNAFNFYADSHSEIVDYGASSSTTSNKPDFIEGVCNPLTDITILGIASGIQASSILSIILHLVEDDNKAIGMQIDRFLYLKGLPTMLLRPKQILK